MEWDQLAACRDCQRPGDYEIETELNLSEEQGIYKTNDGTMWFEAQIKAVRSQADYSATVTLVLNLGEDQKESAAGLLLHTGKMAKVGIRLLRNNERL